jgi:rubrerythrin
MEEFPPTSEDGVEDIAEVRIEYAGRAEGIGSVPPMEDKASEELVMFMDKLGARVAFERTGVRLYQALLSKHEAYGGFRGGPTKEELELFRNQEFDHFALLSQATEELGGDPTAVTPSADLQGLMGSGIQQVMVDPRTSLIDSLEAILLVEMADNESWEGLIEMARGLGQDQLVREFEHALDQEREHLEQVRRWIAAGQGRIESH